MLIAFRAGYPNHAGFATIDTKIGTSGRSTCFLSKPGSSQSFLVRFDRTNIETLKKKGEDALMEIGLQERLTLHEMNEVDKADTWLVCLNTARETWNRCRVQEV